MPMKSLATLKKEHSMISSVLLKTLAVAKVKEALTFPNLAAMAELALAVLVIFLKASLVVAV